MMQSEKNMLSEIVDREVAKARVEGKSIDFYPGIKQLARGACFAVAKAIRDRDAEIVQRIGIEQFNKYPPEQPGERSAVTRTVEAIGQAILAAPASEEEGKS